MKGDEKILLLVIASSILLLAVLFPFASFALTTNQTNVTVSVSTVTQITVRPTSISWVNVNPGSTGGMQYVEIENSGSVNISKVYAYVDTLETEPTNPLGSDNSTKYSAGGVLVIKKNETGAKYYYAGRLEWNTSKPVAAGNTYCSNAVGWGWYRNATNRYLWCLINGSTINATHGCNSTGTLFYIESQADDGTPATRDPDVAAGSFVGVADWGIFNFTGGPLDGMVVAAYRDCSKIYIYRYDRRTSPNFDAAALTDEEQSIISTTMAPGDVRTVNLDVWVPEGIPAGNLNPSVLTFEAAL